MNQDIKAIIFDFGGVVIRWDPRRVFRKFFPNDPQAMEDFMVEIGFSAWNLKQDEGYPFPQAVRDLSARFPQYAPIIRAYDVDWEESITGIIQETVALLPRLKAAGYPLYGLTNWNYDKFSLVKDRYSFFKLFDEIIVSGEVKLIKPDPAIYQLLLDKIGRSPQECVVVDDTLHNVEVCRTLGFTALHFTTAVQLESDFKHLSLL